jgi:hypothetical protein
MHATSTLAVVSAVCLNKNVVDFDTPQSVANACHRAKTIKKCAVYLNSASARVTFHQCFVLGRTNVVVAILAVLFRATFFKAKFLCLYHVGVARFILK